MAEQLEAKLAEFMSFGEDDAELSRETAKVTCFDESVSEVVTLSQRAGENTSSTDEIVNSMQDQHADLTVELPVATGKAAKDVEEAFEAANTAVDIVEIVEVPEVRYVERIVEVPDVQYEEVVTYKARIQVIEVHGPPPSQVRRTSEPPPARPEVSETWFASFQHKQEVLEMKSAAAPDVGRGACDLPVKCLSAPDARDKQKRAQAEEPPHPTLHRGVSETVRAIEERCLQASQVATASDGPTVRPPVRQIPKVIYHEVVKEVLVPQKVLIEKVVYIPEVQYVNKSENASA